MQLVILAIWKRTLDISQTETYSSSDPNQEGHDSGEFSYNLRPEDVSPQIEGEFLREVESAENLAKLIEHGMFKTCASYSAQLYSYVFML